MSDCPFTIALAKQGKKVTKTNSKCFNARSLNVFIANDIPVAKVISSKFVIYAHKSSEGIYIGVTSDVVKRWREHNQAAFCETSADYMQPFKKAIRSSAFTHIVLGVSNTLAEANDMEAAAIDFYHPEFNVRPEKRMLTKEMNFKSLEGQPLKSMVINQVNRNGSDYSRKDCDRVQIIAEVYTSKNRKRLRPAPGQQFPTSLNIECSRDERNKLSNGDKVKVKVALTTKSNGQKHLVAAKTAVLRKI